MKKAKIKLPGFIKDDSDMRGVFEFAHDAHSNRTEDGEPQLRKHSGLPYMVHPVAVAAILYKTGRVDKNMLKAALLHDVVEDTLVEANEILDWFGEDVAMLVMGMTKKSMYVMPDEIRAKRKAYDRIKYAAEGARVQTIKAADINHNAACAIVESNDKWASMWLGEAKALLTELDKADKELRDRVLTLLDIGIEMRRVIK